MATPKKDNPQKAGRKPKFSKDILETVTNYCLCGVTNDKLAVFLKISEKTLYAWIKKYPELSKAIFDGRDGAMQNVANALYRSALGYEHDAIELKVVSIGDGMSEVQKVKVKKKYPPNYQAMSFFMRNKDGARWKEKTDVDANITVNEYEIKLPENNEP